MRKDKYDLAKLLIDTGRIRVDVEYGVVETLRRNGEYMQPAFTGAAYQTFILYVDHKQQSFTVHQLVMIASGVDITGLEINHIDGNKLNNSRMNLETISRSKNMKHFYKMYYARQS